MSKVNRCEYIRNYLEMISEVSDKLENFAPSGPFELTDEEATENLRAQYNAALEGLPDLDKFKKIISNPPPKDSDPEDREKEKEDFKELRKNLCEQCSHTWSTAYLVAEQSMLIAEAKKAHSIAESFTVAYREYEYVPVELEEAPPLPEGLQTFSDGESTLSEKTVRHKKGKKSNKKSKLILVGPSVDLNEGQLDLPPEGTSSGDFKDVSVPIFPGSKHMIELIFEPGHSVPVHKGDRIKFSDLDKYPVAEIVWLPASDPKYYEVPTLNTAAVSALHESGSIPSAIKSLLMDKVTDSLEGKPNFLSKADAITKYGNRQVEQAELVRHWAAAERELKKHDKLVNKVEFINKWMSRLADVPEPLVCSHASFLLAKFIKQANGDVTKINKTFYGFLAGNLANWKVGETREAMLKRNFKSVQAYWGPQAATYVEKFKETPDGSLLIRPKPDPLAKRLAKLKSQAERKGWKAYSEVAAGLSELSEQAKEELVTAKVLSADLPYRQRVKVYWSRMASFGGRVKNIAKPTVSTSFTKIGNVLDQLTDRVARLVTGSKIAVTGNGLVVTNWFHKVTFRYKHPMTKEAPSTWHAFRSLYRNRVEDFSKDVEDRPWWSWVKGITAKAVWKLGTPIRWFGSQLNYSIAGDDANTTE